MTRQRAMPLFWLLATVTVALGADGVPVDFGVDDQPAPLTATAAGDESEQDRRAAAVWYAQGRLAELRQDRLAALRRYQRAWRYDPQATAVGRRLVTLAMEIDRPAEAARYAALLADQLREDPGWLTRLGRFAIEHGEVAVGVTLLERSVDLGDQPTGGMEMTLQRAELASMHWELSQFSSAAGHYERVWQVISDQQRSGWTDAEVRTFWSHVGDIYAPMFDAFLRTERWPLAADLLEQADSLTPHERRYYRARLAAGRGDWATARAELHRYLTFHPRQAGSEAYELLCWVVSQQIPAAEAAERRVLGVLADLYRRDRRNDALKRVYALRLVAQGQLRAAARLLDELPTDKMTPDLLQARGQIAQQTRDWPALLRVLGIAVDRTGTLAGLGDFVDHLSRDEKAVEQFLQFTSTADDSIQEQSFWFGAALVAILADRREAADQFLAKAFEADGRPPAELCATAALAWLERDRFAQAIVILERALADEVVPPSERPAFNYYLAGALELAGRHEQALRAAETAVGLRPDLPAFEERVAWVLYREGKYREARERYVSCLQRYDTLAGPAGLRETLRDVRFALSTVDTMLGEPAEAEEWLEQILDEFPRDAGALNDLAYLWIEQGRHRQRALAMAQEAVAQEPHNPAYRDTLGWVYFHLGRHANAVRELEQAVSVSGGDDPVILDHLGDACLKSGQREQALEAWRRAAEAFDRLGGERAETIRAKIREQRQD